MTGPENSPTNATSLRETISLATLQSEAELYPILEKTIRFGKNDWEDVRKSSEVLITKLRSVKKPPLIDQFLTEYGLSNNEGVQLMRLAEALSRTTDPVTADQLIADKITGGDWLSHAGAGHANVMSGSGYAMHLADKWLQWSSRNHSAATGWLARTGNAVVRSAARKAVVALSSQFVFAETLDGAMRRASEYERSGYLFSFDMLGEAARTQHDAEKYYRAYSNALETVASHAKSNDPSKNHGISIKLSALHPRYEYAQAADVVPEIVEILIPLATKARASNVQLTIDAEEVERLDISMDVLAALIARPELKGWRGLGFVVQAYQRRALPLLDWLNVKAAELDAPLMIRLVKGAYWDSEIKRAQEMGLESYPVFTRKEMTDLSYLACARKLLDHPESFSPQFATHNAQSVAAVRLMAGDTENFEFQRLFGMGQQLHDDILAETSISSRIYAPVGTQKDLLSYLIRRLLENGANSSFVNKLVDPGTDVATLAIDPATILKSFEETANPSIPKPRDLFSGERLSAEGWDLSNPLTQDRFENEFASNRTDSFVAAPIIKGVTIKGEQEAIHNPANLHQKIGVWRSADKDSAAATIRAAREALTHWTYRSAIERAKILDRAASLLEQRASLFHALAISEAGKTWPDAVAEVREAVDFCRYYAARVRDKSFVDRQGLGVVVCISPWNFPLAIFLGQVTAALAAGNTVVAKPAEQTPLIAAEAIRLLHDAGVDPAAVNLVPGNGADVGEALVSDPEVSAICFTGSTATAKHIAGRLAETGRPLTPLIAETGGINAMIVDSSALLEQTIDDVVSSAFQSAGQRCSALRVLCVQDTIADECIKLLSGAMDVLRVGNPAEIQTDIGPVIDQPAMDNIHKHIQRLDKTARQIGQSPHEVSDSGYFVAPVAYELGDILQLEQEIFGPVLHVVRFPAEQKMEMIERVNAMGYGLTLGIQSRIDDLSNALASKADVGNIYINRNQIGAVVGVQPFGGEGLSGTGPKAGGPLYLYRLSKTASSHASVKSSEDGADSSPDKTLLADDDLTHKFQLARISQKRWSSLPERDLLSNLTSRHDSKIAACVEREFDRWQHFADSCGLLPSPAGETNFYSLHPRGVILSIAQDPDAILQAAIRALITGNVFFHLWQERSVDVLDQLGEIVNGHKDTCALIQQHQMASMNDISEFLASSKPDGVFVSNKQPELAEWASLVAHGDGPIIPFLSSGDGPERYVLEKTVTRNIAAAGGDISLLNA